MCHLRTRDRPVTEFGSGPFHTRPSVPSGSSPCDYLVHPGLATLAMARLFRFNSRHWANVVFGLHDPKTGSLCLCCFPSNHRQTQSALTGLGGAVIGALAGALPTIWIAKKAILDCVRPDKARNASEEDRATRSGCRASELRHDGSRHGRGFAAADGRTRMVAFGEKVATARQGCHYLPKSIPEELDDTNSKTADYSSLARLGRN